MGGLTRSGFEPETIEEIKQRIEAKLEAFSPGFDFSPESPDGNLIGIMSTEMGSIWQQLSLVYDSYNPLLASGAALRNLSLISGLPYGVADKSYATVAPVGEAEAVLLAGTILLDQDGNEFYTVTDAAVGQDTRAIAVVSGEIPVPAGTISSLRTAQADVYSVTQATDGVMGSAALTDVEFRNLRQQTAMRNGGSVADRLEARLLELGATQIVIVPNITDATVDSIPAHSIEVTIGDVGALTNADIGLVILNNTPIGTGTYGTTSVNVKDSRGVTHAVKFTKAVALDIEIDLDVHFASTNTAGARENIIQALVDHVNALPSGGDVIWSRLFGVITPYSEAEVLNLDIGELSGVLAPANIVVAEGEYAKLETANVNFLIDGA